MLSINNLSYYIGGRPIYEDASLHIKIKDKIGLVGLNGTGKTSLLRLINGEYQPDKGDISKSNDCTIGFLNQDLLSFQSDDSILNVAMQAFSRALDIHRQIDDLLHKMEKHYEEKLVEKLTKLQEQFEALDGYTIQSKAEEILEGIGFSTKDLQRPLKEFSGGWRMRVMLAKLLLEKPSLLMLDEPTNHLDLPSIQWVENYLRNYEGALLVVSHDMHFLDNIVQNIVEVSGQQLNYYSGGYSSYLEEKSMRAEIQKNAYENQQQKIKQTEKFIEKFRSKATKARQVQSRIKTLERMDIVDEVVNTDAKVNFRFTFSQKSGRHVVQFKNLSKSFGELKILENSEAGIERGDKIALIGANGRGKSTLLRIIAGTESFGGERVEGYNVNFAFYAQHQLEALHIENPILDELKQAGSNKTEQELRGVLGCFLFSDEDVFKKIKVLSGGEKSRVALAKTLISEANFLLLDEPTNHLDMQSVSILIQALQQYEGTFITVSHDRHFIEEIATKIWYIENYKIKEYPGNYEEYEYWRKQQEASAEKTPVVKKAEREKTKESNNNTNTPSNAVRELQKELKKYNKDLEETEAMITSMEANKAKLEKELSLPEIYEDKTRLNEVNEKYSFVLKSLEKENDKWEQTVLAIEELNEKISESSK